MWILNACPFYFIKLVNIFIMIIREIQRENLINKEK